MNIQTVEDRPPSRINGKFNPLYREWYCKRLGISWSEYQKKWRAENPEKYIVIRNRALEIRKKFEHDNGIRVKKNEFKCVICGLAFEKYRAFKFINTHKGICDCCSHET